jgi:hypothetical protein
LGDSFKLKTGYLKFGVLLLLRQGFEISGEVTDPGIHDVSIHLDGEGG